MTLDKELTTPREMSGSNSQVDNKVISPSMTLTKDRSQLIENSKLITQIESLTSENKKLK